MEDFEQHIVTASPRTMHQNTFHIDSIINNRRDQKVTQRKYSETFTWSWEKKDYLSINYKGKKITGEDTCTHESFKGRMVKLS